MLLLLLAGGDEEPNEAATEHLVSLFMTVLILFTTNDYHCGYCLGSTLHWTGKWEDKMPTKKKKKLNFDNIL